MDLAPHFNYPNASHNGVEGYCAPHLLDSVMAPSNPFPRALFDESSRADAAAAVRIGAPLGGDGGDDDAAAHGAWLTPRDVFDLTSLNVSPYVYDTLA